MGVSQHEDTKYIAACGPWDAIKHTFCHMDIKNQKNYPKQWRHRAGERPSWWYPSDSAGCIPLFAQDATWQENMSI